MAAIEDGLVSSPTVQNTLHRHLKVSIKSPCLKSPSLFIQNTEPYSFLAKKKLIYYSLSDSMLSYGILVEGTTTSGNYKKKFFFKRKFYENFRKLPL